jgi:hypothetical protein
MRLTLAVGALQPRRDHWQRPLPPARLHPLHPRAVVPGPGPGRHLLHVLQAAPVPLLQDFLPAGRPHPPQHRLPLIPGQPGPPLVLPDRRVHDADRLVEAGRHIGVGRGPAGPLRRLPLQLHPPLPRRVRLCRQQASQDVRLLRVLPWAPAKPFPRHRVHLRIDRQERRRLHHLPAGEPQRLRAPAEPPARRLPRLRRIQVIPARHLLPRGLLGLALEHVTRVEPRLGAHPDSHLGWLLPAHGADHDRW